MQMAVKRHLCSAGSTCGALAAAPCVLGLAFLTLNVGFLPMAPLMFVDRHRFFFIVPALALAAVNVWNERRPPRTRRTWFAWGVALTTVGLVAAELSIHPPAILS